MTQASDNKSLKGQGAFIPYSFFEGFIRFVANNNDKIEVITYHSINWDSEVSEGQTRFPIEWKHWTNYRRPILKKSKKAQLLIQHDVDSYPERTNKALVTEANLGVISTSMVFNKRVDRRQLSKTGEVIITDYDIDHTMLRELTKKGFVVGYHSNAFEQAGFNHAQAEEIFCRDVDALRELYDIRYFSPHGGARSPIGEKNRDLDHKFTRDLNLRYVQNGGGPKFTNGFSDGALNGSSIPPKERDLRNFIMSLRPGDRYRVLLHPQYYDHEYRKSKVLYKANWYRELLSTSSQNPKYDPWSNVKLSW